VPAFTVKLADGKAVSLADFRGKYLLINVWRTDFNVWLPELSALTPVWDAYKNDPRLAMLGISYDRTPLPARTYTNAKAIPWPQALAIGRTTLIPAVFPLRQQSVAWLIDPDGKVIAANLRGEQIKAAVDKALGK
jgi:AhpC/TSA family